MAIIHWVKIGQKQKSRLWVHETPILEEIFVILTENSSGGTHFHAWHGTKTDDGEAFRLLLLRQSPYYQVA